jgi:hypothetical protein
MDEQSQTSKESLGGDYKRLLEAGADITGNLAGSALGFLVAGPVGGFVGAAASPVVKHLVGLATDVVHRSISERETKRIGAALTFATAKIRERLDAGHKLREDGFFTDSPSARAPASEIAEGIVLAAQREHEEKKLRCYGTLLANLAFAPGIDRAYSNFLLKTAEALTYRQLCLLTLFTLKDAIQGRGLRQTDYRPALGQAVSIPVAAIPVLYEVFDLYSRGLVSCGGSALLGLTDVNPSQMTVQGAGTLLVNLMELHTLDLVDVNTLIPPLQ